MNATTPVHSSQHNEVQHVAEMTTTQVRSLQHTIVQHVDNDENRRKQVAGAPWLLQLKRPGLLLARGTQTI